MHDSQTSDPGTNLEVRRGPLQATANESAEGSKPFTPINRGYNSSPQSFRAGCISFQSRVARMNASADDNHLRGEAIELRDMLNRLLGDGDDETEVREYDRLRVNHAYESRRTSLIRAGRITAMINGG